MAAMESVYSGQIDLIRPEPPKAYETLLKWADKVRTLGVRTNADTPRDARLAREMGAEGIGLCRTEHMFFKDFEQPEKSIDRQEAIQEMILADAPEARRKALAKLLPFQRRDFIGIFEAMNGLPVTIRMIDPPLHEFVPHDRAKQEELAKKIGISVEAVARRVEQLHEANPMLGHRGCRLSITYPEIQEMQVRAIIEAAIDCQKRGIKVLPEIMIPLTLDKKEFQILETLTRRVADEIISQAKVKLEYLVGTMIELPRAALLADEIAEVAEFFSFGTNDLTQTTMGLSRDDAGRFLPEYVDQSKAAIFKDDPFQTLDVEGVGMLIEWAIARGRKTRPKLKIGICGEHGGDGESVKFCHRAGMNYVSASPFRVPIARLAAAQAVIEGKRAAKRIVSGTIELKPAGKASNESPLLLRVRRELRRIGDPRKALGAQAYMKSAMPYHGVPTPLLRVTCKKIFADVDLPTREVWRGHVLELWRGAKWREERYAAIALAGDKRASEISDPRRHAALRRDHRHGRVVGLRGRRCIASRRIRFCASIRRR